MAFATSKIIACVCAFCAAEMAGELFRKLSENLPIEGACPRLWCRAAITHAGAENRNAADLPASSSIRVRKRRSRSSDGDRLAELRLN